MRLYFIRHAQSSNNELYAATGSSKGRQDDPGITALGEEQASYLSSYLTDDTEFGFTHLYSSLMKRALQTASAISRSTGLTCYGLPELHECGGVYLEDDTTGTMHGQPGKTHAELKLLFSELVLPVDMAETGWWNRPFETVEERPGRAKRVVESLYNLHRGKDDRIALVSHLGFFNYFFWALYGLTRPGPHFSVLHNTGIARFDITHERVELQYINRISHLPPQSISW